LLTAGLNPQQQQAVSAPAGPTLVIAGPGSGKTRVLTNRVAYLISVMGVAPYHIMAVTFTNKAAGEMRKRIEKTLADHETDIGGLTVGTFHSICARLLRREAAAIGYQRDFLIYDTDDQISLMKQVLAEANIDEKKVKPRSVLNAVSNAKNELITPERYPTHTPQDRQTAQLYARYQAMLKQNNALDFDDLLMQMVFLFRQNPQIAEAYQSKYQHILVDEFQDTNTAQYELLRLLAGTENSLFCVGDPDQSIYRFRGADYRNIGLFQRDYPQTAVILLEQNYRSHQTILNAAMAIIDRNPDRIRKQLHTARTDDQKITLKNLMDDKDEAQYVAWTIKQYRQTGRFALRDCAVMYRTNAQSRVLEEIFTSANIPYRLIGGIRFYSRKEIKDLLAYLRLVQNPNDSVSFRRVVNEPPRGIGKTTLTALEGWASRSEQGLYDSVKGLATASELPFTKKAAKSLTDFVTMIDSWRALRGKISIGLLMHKIVDDVGYMTYLGGNDVEEREKQENVMEFLRATEAQTDKPLDTYLEEVALIADVDNYDAQAESVVMLTLHAAKGLEFPVVFIVGLEEGILPHNNALGANEGSKEDIAEERRLFYVGITRAEDVLHITWARRRSAFGGPGEYAMPSSFLSDLPDSAVMGSPVPGRNAGGRGLGYQEITKWQQSTSQQIASQPSRPNRPASTRISIKQVYKSGQRVRHERFGDGVIITSSIRGEEEEIDVRFEKFGFKRLSAGIAPLTLLEDDD
jgi:DNA helicase II / ATP-dependent DNA helicase PcrA